MSLGMMVTRLAQMAHKLVASNRPTNLFLTQVIASHRKSSPFGHTVKRSFSRLNSMSKDERRCRLCMSH